MIKILLVALAVVIVAVGGLLQHREKGISLAALLVLLTFTGDVLSEVAADMIKPLFFGGESTSEETGDRSVVQGEAGLSPAPESKPEAPPESAAPPDAQPESKPEAPPESAAPDRSEPESGTPPEPEPEPPEVPADPLEGVPDISGQRSVSGSLTEQGQEVQYQYTAPTSGIYRFDTGVSYGGVSMEVKDQAGRRVDGGRNALTVSLRAGELYTLSVFQAYMSLPAEYTVSVTAQQDPA